MIGADGGRVCVCVCMCVCGLFAVCSCSMQMEMDARRVELETHQLMELQLADQARQEAENALVWEKE